MHRCGYQVPLRSEVFVFDENLNAKMSFKDMYVGNMLLPVPMRTALRFVVE